MVKILYLIIGVLLFVSGCSTRNYTDLYPYQPFAGDKERAETIIRNNIYIETTETVLYWVVGNEKINANNLVEECQVFLKKTKSFSGPIDIVFPRNYDCRYPWGLVPDYGFTLTEAKEGEFILEEKESFVELLGELDIKTIVCLKPLVVLSVPGKILNQTYVEIVYQGMIENLCISIDYGTKKGVFVILDHGFAYGTRMPYDPNPKWFSPDLDVAPRPVEMLSEDKGRIPVPWGYLVLNRKNDEWIVTTESK